MGYFGHGGSRLGDDGTVKSAQGDYISGVDSPVIAIRVQSPFDGSGAAASSGDDLRADPLHNSVPFLSLPKAIRWANERVPGRRVAFHLFADIYNPTLGSDQRLWGINVVESTGKRWYRCAELYTLPYGEAFRCRATYHGPRKMTPISLQLAGVSGAGGHTIDTQFIATGLQADSRSWIRTWVSVSDKREVFFKIPIAALSNDNSRAYIDSSLTGADLNADLVGAACYQVQPSVIIAPPDGVMSGVRVHGDRTRMAGDRDFSGVTDSPADVFCDFEQIHIVRLQLCAPARFVECFLDDKPTVEWTGAFGSYNTIVIQLLEHRGRAMPLVESWQRAPTIEPCGRPLKFTNGGNPSVDDPVIPANGTNLVVQGGLLLGGESFGQPGGELVCTKGLSVRGTGISVASTPGITGHGGSRLYMHNNSVMYVEGFTGFDAIWAKEGSEFRLATQTAGVLDGARIKVVQPENRHVRAGIAAAVALGTGTGQFREVAGINGNLISAFDRSRIWDKTREEADAAYNPIP